MIEINLPKEGYYLINGPGVHLCVEINNKKLVYDFTDEAQAYKKLVEIKKYGLIKSWWMIFSLIPEYPLGSKGYKWLVGDSDNGKHISLSWDFVGMCPIEKNHGKE